MGSAVSTIQEIGVSEIRNRLESLLHDVVHNETRFVIATDDGPVAALIPVAALRRLIQLDALDREARQVVADMRESFRDVPDEEIAIQTEAIMAEIREEQRTARARTANLA